MKTTITLLLVVSYLATFGQIPKQTWKNIPKNTQVLFIQNNHSASENYNLVAQTLLNNNYAIENTNKDFLTINTAPIPLKSTGIIKLNFICTQNQIKISGLMQS